MSKLNNKTKRNKNDLKDDKKSLSSVKKMTRYPSNSKKKAMNVESASQSVPKQKVVSANKEVSISSHSDDSYMVNKAKEFDFFTRNFFNQNQANSESKLLMFNYGEGFRSILVNDIERFDGILDIVS